MIEANKGKQLPAKFFCQVYRERRVGGREGGWRGRVVREGGRIEERVGGRMGGST